MVYHLSNLNNLFYEVSRINCTYDEQYFLYCKTLNIWILSDHEMNFFKTIISLLFALNSRFISPILQQQTNFCSFFYTFFRVKSEFERTLLFYL